MVPSTKLLTNLFVFGAYHYFNFNFGNLLFCAGIDLHYLLIFLRVIILQVFKLALYLQPPRFNMSLLANCCAKSNNLHFKNWKFHRKPFNTLIGITLKTAMTHV